MKRNDGVDRRLPLSTHKFGRLNPDRVHVVKGAGRWRVYRGTLLIGFDFSFGDALAFAHEVAQ